MQIHAKIIKVTKNYLALLVALKQIYNMEFRAKLYLKEQACSTRSKSEITQRTVYRELGTENEMVTAIDLPFRFTSCRPKKWVAENNQKGAKNNTKM